MLLKLRYFESLRKTGIAKKADPTHEQITGLSPLMRKDPPWSSSSNRLVCSGDLCLTPRSRILLGRLSFGWHSPSCGIAEDNPLNSPNAEGASTKRLATLGPGEYFGEIALLKQKTRSATVRCTKALDLLALPQGEFQALIANLPDLRTSFESVMEKRIQRENDTGTSR